jgi:hypothetical protein
MRWTRSIAMRRPDPATMPPKPTSMARAHQIHEGRRELRRRATASVVHEEEEERRRGEAGSSHHTTGSGLHGPRPPDPRDGREEGAPPW